MVEDQCLDESSGFMNDIEKILIIALLVLIVIMVWLCSKLYKKKKRKKLLLDLDMGFEEIPDYYDFEDKVIRFNYEQLDDRKKQVYDIMLEGILKYETIIDVGSCDQNTADIVFRSILSDHPELFWLSGAYTFYTTDESNKIKPVTLIKFHSVERYKNKLNKTIDAIIVSTAMAEDTYERIVMLHDYIVDHSKYDIKAKKKYSSNPFASTSYGCLVENAAICSGYSKGFQLLLNRIGVSCGYISGVCKDGERHAWNYVQFGKDFYYVDVTFDDPLQNKSQYDNKSHRYFFVTTDDILKSREISNDNGFVPKCRSIKYNYFVYTGRYFKRYSIEELKHLIEVNKDNQIEFRFATKEVYDEAVYGLFSNKECYDIIRGRKITYFKDDKFFVIKLCY